MNKTLGITKCAIFASKDYKFFKPQLLKMTVTKEDYDIQRKIYKQKGS